LAVETDVQVRWISPPAIELHATRDVKALLERDDGFVWVDVPECDDDSAALLLEVFGFHPLAVKACRERSHVPKVHAYQDHQFVVLHAPESGDAGHVHLLELDQFVGRRYLVTTHGPLGERVDPDSALRETRALAERLDAGRFRPASPAELSHAIVSRLSVRMESFVSALANRIAIVERRIMNDDARDPEAMLEEIFRLRHELLTVRTMAAQSREAYARMLSLARAVPAEGHAFIEDIVDQFDRLRSLCDGEKEFLQGVLDFYQSRTTTKMNIAMERLALLASILLPVTAVASVYGMNIITNDRTDFPHVAVVVGVMLGVMLFMFRWAKRQGWW
jgi:Mg2+ and Co2+ transporter CorA